MLKGKILVVDDNPANTQLLHRLLSPYGYDLEIADCGQAALDLVSSFEPEMVLLDIDLPDYDGYEVATAIKAERREDLMVIFISALSDLEQIVRGFDVGGIDYITKPFMPREVLARVDRHFNYRHQQVELQNLLQRENQRIAALNHMRQQFVFSATHDLKNPLNQIMGFTDILRTDPRLEHEDLQNYLHYINLSAEKMRVLVEDMLDLAQLEGIGVRSEALQINQLAERCFNALKVMAEQNQVELIWKSELEGPINVMGDPDRIARVLDNLISNALKYTSAGGNVTVSLNRTDEFVGIHVRDTGIGISATDLAQLFEPFYRVRRPETEHIVGSGLGLFIVKTIVEQHGGEITVDSHEGRGSVFTVWLPL